jgi:hypothetical protein
MLGAGVIDGTGNEGHCVVDVNEIELALGKEAVKFTRDSKRIECGKSKAQLRSECGTIPFVIVLCVENDLVPLTLEASPLGFYNGVNATAIAHKIIA